MTLHQLYQQALTSHQQGQLKAAETGYRQLLASPGLEPLQRADVLHLLGVLHHQNERHADAISCIEAAFALDAGNPDYLNNLGLALRAYGEPERAILCYRQALRSQPDDIDILTNLGNCLHGMARYREAADCYRSLLTMLVASSPPDQAALGEIRHALCHSLQQLGDEHQRTGDYAMAMRCLDEAIQRFVAKPRSEQDKRALAIMHYNLGNAQRELAQPLQAAASYRLALQDLPGDADIHNNLGNVLRECGELQQAMDCYRQATALNPQLYHAQVHLTHQKQHACDWGGADGNGISAEFARIRTWVNQQPMAQVSPFAFLAIPGSTPQEQQLCADRWLQNRYQQAFEDARRLAFQHQKPTQGAFSVATQRPLRIGYLSADFRLHPLAALISELMEMHDRLQVQIWAYSYGPDDGSSERQRLQRAFDHFIDIRSMPQLEAARRIHADQIDILVDLTGFTQGSRTAIAAMRPAPINVSWLGYAGTMGSVPIGNSGVPTAAENSHLPRQALFDYLLSDAVITPLAEAGHYAEKLALLPHCYQPNDRKRAIADRPRREDCGLPPQAFVFCCFNQTFKLTPDVFSVWMQLLQAVPGSVLWLLQGNPLAVHNLQLAAKTHGIEAERLVFAPRLPMAQHLARHALADLFLDTLPYNAHTTASDALWMGLPLLTCKGETFPSRVAASLLTAAGVPELVTENLADYQQLAEALARDPQRLTVFREKLRAAAASSPLFDTSGFARHLEAMYRHMWQQWQAGLPAVSVQLDAASEQPEKAG